MHRPETIGCPTSGDRSAQDAVSGKNTQWVRENHRRVVEDKILNLKELALDPHPKLCLVYRVRCEEIPRRYEFIRHVEYGVKLALKSLVFEPGHKFVVDSVLIVLVLGVGHKLRVPPLLQKVSRRIVTVRGEVMCLLNSRLMGIPFSELVLLLLLPLFC